MQIGNKFRCYPTAQQEEILLRWIGCQRYIYNAKVGEDDYFRRFAGKSLQLTGQYAPIDQQYSNFKTDMTPWLSEVPSTILRNGTVLWKQAYSRYFAKLAQRPVFQRKFGKQAVWLKSDLFEFVPINDKETGLVSGCQLHLGTKKYPFGVLNFTAHKDFQPPASLHISIHAGRWHVSFNYDDNTEKETTDWLLQFDEIELREKTVGLDRGVNLPLAGSDQQKFDFSEAQKLKLLKEEQHKKRWQRRLARTCLSPSIETQG